MTLHEPRQAGKPNPNANHLSLHALLLAAGRGGRFGGSKLQAEYRHRPLLAYPLAIIAAARERGLIDGGSAVIPDDKASFRLVRDVKLEPIVNSAPERGLSFSLQLGLAALSAADTPAAALIFLGDQPLVRLDVVEALISAWQGGGGAIIRPRYDASPDVPGHPVLIARSAWTLVQDLRGDAGFSSLGSRLTETIVGVTGHNPDVDTSEDLQALEVLHQ